MDDSRQSRDQLFAEDRIRPLRGHRRARGQLGQAGRPASSSPTNSRTTSFEQARVRVQEACAGLRPMYLPRSSARIRSKASATATTSMSRSSPAIMSPTTPAPASCIPRPGHGRDDFDIWTANAREARGARHQHHDPLHGRRKRRASPPQAPGFTGKRVLNDKGEKGDANEAVIKALIDAGMLLARGRLKHQYPHSWRSKKPLIFRNTPQWFIAMDKPIADWWAGKTRRHSAPPRAGSHQGDPLGAGRRREPHQRHDREPGPTGSSRASAPGACRSRYSCARAATARSKS